MLNRGKTLDGLPPSEKEVPSNLPGLQRSAKCGRRGPPSFGRVQKVAGTVRGGPSNVERGAIPNRWNATDQFHQAVNASAVADVRATSFGTAVPISIVPRFSGDVVRTMVG